MAINYPNYAGIPAKQPDYSGIANFIANRDKSALQREMLKEAMLKNELDKRYGAKKREADLLTGAAREAYSLEQLPSLLEGGIKNPNAMAATEKYEQGIETGKLNQDVLRAKLESILHPKEKPLTKLDEAKIKYYEQGGARGAALPSQDFRDTIFLEKKRQELGEDNPQYQALKKSYDSKQEYRAAQTEARKAYSQTPIYKLLSEYDAIKSGVDPHTKKKLTSDAQKEKESEYYNRIKAGSSDKSVRDKLGYALNIDKTLSSIDIDNLVRYAGIAGATAKKWEEWKAPFGLNSKEYEKYQQNLNSIHILADQVRQFYGTSIQPNVRESLELLFNPASIKNNPKVAKAKFLRAAEILKKETQTYKDIFKNKHAYSEEDKSDKSTRIKGIPSTNNADVYNAQISALAKKYNVSPETGKLLIEDEETGRTRSVSLEEAIRMGASHG